MTPISSCLAPLEKLLLELQGRNPDTWAERLCADQRRRWPSGERPRVEDYLRGLPALAEREDLLDLIYGEVLLREAAGEHPQLAELQERFPMHRDALARQWEVHLAIESEAAWQTQPAQTLPPPADAAAPSTTSDGFDVRAVSGENGEEPLIPGYDILDELGRGGNGVVYLARQRSLNRLVAIKMIAPERKLTEAMLARLRSEAALIARLQHPHIVSIYRVGLCEDRPYLVLEHVSGGSLADRLNGQPWPASRAAALVETLARTLAVVHEQGIIHRDLKPGNVLLSSSFSRGSESREEAAHVQRPARFSEPRLNEEEIATPKIVDFGLAKALDESVEQGVTQTGELVGTPRYMAPEQAQGKADLVGPATDQHALGVLLYELLTGTVPYVGETAFDVISHIAFTPPLPPSRRVGGISADLDAIVLRCLAKDPQERYPSTLALAEDLHRVRHGFPSHARRVRFGERVWLWSRRQPVVAALLLAVLLALVGGLAAVSVLWRRAESARGVAAAAQTDAESALADVGAARLKLEEALAKTAEAQRKEAKAARELRTALGEVSNARGEAEAALVRSLVALARGEHLQKNFARAEEYLDACPAAARDWEWRYLARLCRLRLATLDGPRDTALSVAISPDGRWYAAAFAPGIRRFSGVRLWAASTGKTSRVLDGARCVAFHPSGQSIAVGAPAGGVLLYTLSDKAAEPIVIGEGKDTRVIYRRLTFSPDGACLAAESKGALHLWTFQRNGKPRPRAAGGALQSVPLNWSEKEPAKTVELRATAFRHDSKQLAVAARSQVRVWDLTRRQFASAPRAAAKRGAPQRPMRLLLGKDRTINALAWVGDKWLVVGGPLGALSVYETAKLQPSGQAEAPSFTLLAHTSTIQGLCSAQSLLASVSSDGTARIWDMDKRQEVVRLPGAHAIALDAKGERLLTAQRDWRLGVWRTRPPAESNQQKWHDRPAFALAFSPAGSWGDVLASADLDGVVRFDDLHKLDKAANEWRPGAPVLTLAYHPRGQVLAAGLAGGMGPEVPLLVLDVVSRRQVPLAGHKGGVTAVAFSPDGKWLASAGRDGGIRLWEGALTDLNWKLARTLPGHQGPVSGIAFGPAGRRLASTGADGKLMLWNVHRGKLISEVQVRPARPRVETARSLSGQVLPGVAYSPDGKQVATPGRPGAIVLWDVETGADELLVGHTAEVHALAYSPDGRRLASGGADGSVRLWDPLRAEEVLVLNGHTRPVLALAFSANGRFLVTSARDSTMLVHEAPVGR
jgi:WD40 repeat protein/serine/threonine protein kinase